MPDKIRTLLFSTLYPSSVRPNHGIFVETRLRHLLASGSVETQVVAPVPWFPLTWATFGDYALHAAVPRLETYNGISVAHPRYLLLPKIGMNLAPAALARAGLAAVRRLVAEGFDFDLIDAHYFYPDGVAAARIGRALGKPVVITARGSDINLIADYPVPRRHIIDAAARSAAVIAVSDALKDRLTVLGAQADKITVLRNGVDLDRFYPEARESARAKLGVSRYLMASVGNLVPLKGHGIAIRAAAAMPGTELVIAGAGPEEAALKRLIDELNIGDRVRLLGRQSQERLRTLYSAADCLILASEREGCPNVLLEALACGCPVVATRTGGIPEILTVPEAGTMMAERSVGGLIEAVAQLRAGPPVRDATRRYAQMFGWTATTEGQIALFERIRQRADKTEPAARKRLLKELT